MMQAGSFSIASWRSVGERRMEFINFGISEISEISFQVSFQV